MKKNNIIDDWLNKHSDPKIEEKVKKEIKDGVKSPLVQINNKI